VASRVVSWAALYQPRKRSLESSGRVMRSAFHFTLSGGVRLCSTAGVPRSPGIGFPDAVYHVTCRGQGRARIFFDDRHRFLRLLRDGVESHGRASKKRGDSLTSRGTCAVYPSSSRSAALIRSRASSGSFASGALSSGPSRSGFSRAA